MKTMDLKELSWMLGVERNVHDFQTVMDDIHLPRSGRIFVAHWQHPKHRTFVPCQSELDALSRYIQPGDITIDIGAFTGNHSIRMGILNGLEGSVLAIEPNPVAYKILHENARLNRKRMAIVPLHFNPASSDRDMDFVVTDYGGYAGYTQDSRKACFHPGRRQFPVRGLHTDSFIQQQYPEIVDQVRLIRIRSIGREPEVLLSLEQIIRQSKPFIQVVLRKGSPDENRTIVYEMLEQFGYRIYRSGDPLPYQEAPVRLQEVLLIRQMDLFAVPVGNDPEEPEEDQEIEESEIKEVPGSVNPHITQ